MRGMNLCVQENWACRHPTFEFDSRHAIYEGVQVMN